jgi:hypothetical protein
MGLLFVATEPSNPEGEWQLRYQREDRSFHHNHPPTTGVLPGHRRRERTSTIRDLIRSGQAASVSVNQTLALIKQSNPSSSITPQDIRNERKMNRREGLQELTVAEATIRVLAENEFHAPYVLNEQRSLEYLMILPQSLLETFQRSPDVLILDCTFKTNRYCRPLLNIISVNGNNTTIHLGVILLPGQSELDFVWAMEQLSEVFRSKRILSQIRLFVVDRDRACINAIKRVFPTKTILICKWHVNKAVQTFCNGIYPNVSCIRSKRTISLPFVFNETTQLTIPGARCSEK